MRKLASVRRVKEIRPHPDADLIELVVVDGWQVVAKKDDFRQGDLVVYFEIDSWVPHSIAPFLTKGDKGPRIYNEVPGERLRTVKLRGQLSQGLVLPVSILDGTAASVEDGEDVTEVLDVQKWEAPIPAELAGTVCGNFPSFIRKTDQERCQNIFSDMPTDYSGGWVVEEKLDGSSCTCYVKQESDSTARVGFCSRNLELKTEGNETNSFYVALSRDNYFNTLPRLGKDIAIQGELCGPGIQKNPYNLQEFMVFVFDVWLIEEHRYATPTERETVLTALEQLGATVRRVPYLGTIDQLPESVDACLQMAEAKSVLNHKTEREGIVFKSAERYRGEVLSMKAVSNKFLLKNDG